MNASVDPKTLFEQTTPQDFIRSLGVRTRLADISVKLHEDTISHSEASTQQVLSWKEFLAGDYSESLKQKAKKEMFTAFRKTHIELGHLCNAKVQVIVFDEEKGQHLSITQHITNHHHTILIIPDNVTASINLTTSVKGNGFSSGGLTCLAGSHVNLFIHEQISSLKEDAFLHRSQIFLGDHSYATWFTTFSGPRIIGGIRAVLDGEQADLTATTQTLQQPGQNIDIDAIVEHVAPQTHSDLFCAGLVKNSSVVTRSLVKIHPLARDSQGYEKTKYLLLDKTARAVSIPDLEIHNDKVKCSHGAMVSKIDPQSIFYLQSRGIAQEDAKELIISGFIEDVLARMPRSCKFGGEQHV